MSELINGRTAEDIKSTLLRCGAYRRCHSEENGDCPYYVDCLIGIHRKKLIKDALVLIERLESERDSFKKAFDEALELNAVQAKSIKVLSSSKRMQWISVKERLPENEERVLITEWNEGFYGKPWRVVMTAFHTDGKTLAQDSDYNWSVGSVEMRYDEEADDFIVPEGWWEDVQCGDEFSMVDAKVTHWMPLPEPVET